MAESGVLSSDVETCGGTTAHKRRWYGRIRRFEAVGATWYSGQLARWVTTEPSHASGWSFTEPVATSQPFDVPRDVLTWFIATVDAYGTWPYLAP